MGKTWRNKPEDGFKVKRKNQPTEKRMNNKDFDTDNQDNYEYGVFSDDDKYDSDKSK
tara:strand:+ start:513 stop:683 length:171 start_codon:yes stop_codon:yes gene_type:complete